MGEPKVRSAICRRPDRYQKARPRGNNARPGCGEGCKAHGQRKKLKLTRMFKKTTGRSLSWILQRSSFSSSCWFYCSAGAVATIGEGDGRCHFSNHCGAKAKSYQKEMNVYEEISGVVYGYHVSIDFYVDWLQSIIPTSSTGGEGSTWSSGSTWSTWCAWSSGSAWSNRRGWCTWRDGSACASARKIGDAGHRGISSPRGYTLSL